MDTDADIGRCHHAATKPNDAATTNELGLGFILSVYDGAHVHRLMISYVESMH